MSPVSFFLWLFSSTSREAPRFSLFATESKTNKQENIWEISHCGETHTEDEDPKKESDPQTKRTSRVVTVLF